MKPRGNESLHYFWGADSFGAREAIGELAAEQQADIRWLDENDLVTKPLRAWLDGARGLFGSFLVVIRDPSNLPAALQEEIVDHMEQEKLDGNALVWVAWDKMAPDKRSRLWRALKAYGREYVPLGASELARWLEEESQKAGASLASGAAPLLVSRVGASRWRLQSEVARLALRESVITPELVATECPAPLTAEIFAALDAVGSGQSKIAVQHIDTLLQRGESELYVLAMIARQFRTLLSVSAGLRANQSPAVIAREGGLHPYVVEKSAAAARRWTESQLLDTLTRVLATDVAIKQGKIDPRTGLLMLTLALTRSFARQ
jgi:DNA polymerase-3 subunit delta